MYKITSDNITQPVEFFASVFENTPSGTQGWTVTEFYKSGVAYRAKHECPTRKEHGTYVICNPSDGLGSDLYDLVGYHFTFDDAYTDVERDLIKNEWIKNGGSLNDKSKWNVEEEYVKIPAGFQVDLIQRTEYFKYNTVESDVLLCDYAD
jgi:hypothetical protein